jgi:hypothetical protein
MVVRSRHGDSFPLPAIHPSLDPVKHLTKRLRRKLIKRARKQARRYRSSGLPYPVILCPAYLVKPGIVCQVVILIHAK